jgi:hypothetical protein
MSVSLESLLEDVDEKTSAEIIAFRDRLQEMCNQDQQVYQETEKKKQRLQDSADQWMKNTFKRPETGEEESNNQTWGRNNYPYE